MPQTFWQGRSVFVTGAGGFLGGWLVKSLLHEGADVTVLVRDHNPESLLARDGLLARTTVVRGCLADLPLLQHCLAERSIQTVFHLAAQPLVGVAMANPVGTLQTNVEGTWNLLEAARRTGVGQTVLASSLKAYGERTEMPYRETHPLEGRHPYDVSKSCADLIAAMYAASYRMPVAIVRCANLFGGGDLNFSRTIPGVIRATLAGERFRIRSDGKSVRDFLYAKDATRSYLLVAESLDRNPELAGEAFNFSLSTPLSVVETVASVLALMGRPDLEPVIENQASGEAREQYLCNDKAHSILGWQPLYGMDQALRETIDWYTEYFAGRRMSPGAEASGTTTPRQEAVPAP